MVGGQHGRSGQCATAVVVVVTRNALAAVPTLRLSTVVPSVMGKASRNCPVILSAQVCSDVTGCPFIGGYGFRCTATTSLKCFSSTCAYLLVPPCSCVSNLTASNHCPNPLTHLSPSSQSLLCVLLVV